MGNKKLFLSVLVAFLLGIVSQSTFAQSKNLARVFMVEVKTGQGAEFSEALKKHVDWRKQQGDPWTWIVYQVVNGKNLGDFIIRSGGHNWKDFDDYEKSFKNGTTEFYKTVGPYIKDVSSIITAGDTVNVDWPENPMDVNLISITAYHLKPGKEREFTRTVSQTHKAIQDNNRDVHYSFGWTVNGEKGPTVRLALPYKNWAAVAGPEESLSKFLMRVLGEDKAKDLMEDFSDTYTSTESMMLLVRWDLSQINSN